MTFAPPHPRYVVVGSSGAGKSTLAAALAACRQCPHIELDGLYWGPDWTPVDAGRFQRLVDEATQGSEWVVDGNYRAVRELVWSRATTVVWLNYSFPRVFAQAVQRTFRRIVRGDRLWHGNRESLGRTLFTRQSILYWIATTYHRRQRELMQLRHSAAHAGITWHEFRHPRQAASWLAAQCHQVQPL